VLINKSNDKNWKKKKKKKEVQQHVAVEIMH